MKGPALQGLSFSLRATRRRSYACFLPCARRGAALPLVKWLLAIPHLILVAIFVGGWGWGPIGDEWEGVGFAGLVGILVIIACVVLLFTGRYAPTLFDFAMGLDRWALRVAAYVGLMRDEYPPFRLDMGPQ